MSFFVNTNITTGVAGDNNISSAAATAATSFSFDDNRPYWEEYGWVPMTKLGKQRTPNMIRNELQRYIDSSSETQTAILARMGVNNNSFHHFMNPKTYKNQWSAVENGTYWAAARLLEAERNKPKEKAVGSKRKATGSLEGSEVAKKSKAEAKAEMLQLMGKINAVEAPGVSEQVVYDSCPQMVKKIKDFLTQDGVAKVDFCLALGGINNNSLNRFLAGKQQDQAENITYHRAYVFFKKKHILKVPRRVLPASRMRESIQRVSRSAVLVP